MSGFLFDSLTNGLQQVLDLRSQQHALTASNLVNAETPGFRAKVIDFDRILGQAVGQSDELQMAAEHPLHIGAENQLTPDIHEIDPGPWAVNGNSVVPEREQARLQQNALMYRAVARGLSRRLSMLKYAANDGR